jgi:hypothetical protein
MAFPFAIPIATTIGGYAVDKMMGGNGMTGAGLGFSAGTMGADGGKGATTGAATTAGGTTPTLLASKNAGAVAPRVLDGLSLGAGGYDATAGLNSLNSGSNLMSSGNNIASASNAFTLPTEVNNVLDIGKEYAGKAYDYVADGLDDMSLVDQASLGLMGYNALGQQDPAVQRVTNGEMLQSNYQDPKDGLLNISVEGTDGSEMTQNELTPEQLKILGLL